MAGHYGMLYISLSLFRRSRFAFPHALDEEHPLSEVIRYHDEITGPFDGGYELIPSKYGVRHDEQPGTDGIIRVLLHPGEDAHGEYHLDVDRYAC